MIRLRTLASCQTRQTIGATCAGRGNRAFSIVAGFNDGEGKEQYKSELVNQNQSETTTKKKTKKKRKKTNVTPTRKAFAPPLHDETLVVMTNGATYQTNMGHPAFTPGKLVLPTDVLNTLHWVTPKVIRWRKQQFLAHKLDKK